MSYHLTSIRPIEHGGLRRYIAHCKCGWQEERPLRLGDAEHAAMNHVTGDLGIDATPTPAAARRDRCEALLVRIQRAVAAGDLWHAHDLATELRNLLVSMHALGDDETPAVAS